MKMVRLVYVSEMADEVTSGDRRDILEQAQEFNRINGLTGILCWKKNYFIQWLEGSSTAVNRLFRSILDDKRHTDIELVDYREVSGREFPEWSMAYIAADDLTAEVFNKFTAGPEFNPYTMSGESICRLLVETAAARKEIIRHAMELE